ncbi:MAG: choice-of-anchor Q domain-containing protein, partial [Verrucomicrobiota bacterium]
GLTVIQSTLFENMSPGGGDGGAIWAGGSNVLINCTVVGNVGPPGGSGIGQYDGAPIFLTNCIVALNSDVNIGGVFSGSNDITNGDPMLSALDNYGGPTLTTLPLPGSPAIDAGSDTVTNFLATDQRGLPRLSGLHVDIGAVELQQAVVKTLQASDVLVFAAILNGMVTPNDLATTWYFEYGTSPSYGAASATNALAGGFSPASLDDPLLGLLAGTTYHYQIFANDGVSVKGGGDETFTTLGIGTAPRLNGVRNLGGGGVEFAFTNFSGDSFSILASTNVALPLDLWTNLGSAMELPPGSGLYQFTDPHATNYPHRFYMVHSP